MPSLLLVQTQTALAESGQLFRRNAWAVVGDLDLDPVLGRHPHPNLGRSPFRGVLQQIAEQLHQIVRHERHDGRGRYVEHPGDTLAIRRALQGAQQAPDGIDHIGPAWRDRGAGAHAGAHQLAIDPPSHRLCELLQVLRQGWIARLAQPLGVGDQGAERGLESMRQIGGPGAGALDCLGARGEQRVDLADQGMTSSG